jgi:hypothetical protein
MMNDMMNDPQKDQAGTALAFGLIGTLLGAIALWKSRTPRL